MDHDLEANGWRQRAFPASWPSLVITADRVCFADRVCVCTDTPCASTGRNSILQHLSCDSVV